MVHSLKSSAQSSFWVPSNWDDSVVWCTLEGWKVGFSGSKSWLIFLEQVHLHHPYSAKTVFLKNGFLVSVFLLRKRVLVLLWYYWCKSLGALSKRELSKRRNQKTLCNISIVTSSVIWNFHFIYFDLHFFHFFPVRFLNPFANPREKLLVLTSASSSSSLRAFWESNLGSMPMVW